MGAYNAGLPIIQAYLQGARLKQQDQALAQQNETQKLRIKMQQDQHKMQAEQQAAEFELKQSVAKIQNLKAVSDLMKGGNIDVPKYDKPTGVTLGQQTQFGQQTIPGSTANVGGQEITSPTIQTPVMGAVPVQTTEQAIVPGTQIAGVDVSNFKTPEAALANEVNREATKAGAITTARENALAPGKQLEREAKAQEAELNRNAMMERISANNDIRERHHAEDMKFKQAQAAATNELQKRRIGLQAERNNIAAAKLAQHTETNNPSEFLDDMAKGVITIDALNKYIPNAKERAQVISAARKADIVPLTNAQVDNLKDIGSVKQFYDGVKALKDKIKGYDKMQLLEPDVIAEITKDQANLRAILEPVAKGLGYKGVITNEEQKHLSTLIPSAYTYNADKKNEAAMEFIKKFIGGKITRVVPPEHFDSDARTLQRAKILHSFGLEE